jgi:Tol biopolymer transport system component
MGKPYGPTSPGAGDDDTVRRLYLQANASGPAQAFRAVLGLEASQFLAEFHATLASAASSQLETRMPASTAAARLLSREATGASVNLAPSLSPDGRWIAFLSTRALELELYLADAETGQVVDRLVRAEADQHMQNLSFIDASAAWSPDGRRFAFGIFARGQRTIALYDLERRRVERRLELPEIDDVRHPAFTPDGNSIVLSGIVGNASDLYRVDLETGDVTRLTNDAYTAIQPVVSPDGRRIVFVTDRGAGTDLDRRAFAALQLATLDVDTGRIDVLPLFERGKHIAPSFSDDGERLYFIAEPDGVPDVFRYDFRDGGLRRVTRLQTGVSGITATSPALSVAANDVLAFSVVEDGRFSVYRMQAPEGEPAARSMEAAAAILPPADAAHVEDVVTRYLADADTGLPPRAARRDTREYAPRLGLTAVSPAAVGVVSLTGRGSALGGAVSAYFNDPLNRHQVITTIQGGSASDVIGIEDTIGADVTYLNQARRFQWGGRLARVPYLSSATTYARRSVDIDGSPMPADVLERLIVAEQISELSMLGWYPFSLNSRIESALGVAHIGYTRELERIVYPDRAPAYRETESLPSPASLELRQASLAFVRDTSTFAFVSPARGMRLRLENQWTTGDLDFRTSRIDYRRYFFRNPLTMAVRLLHVGRHGTGAGDPRLPLLDIGSNQLVRGYDIDSFALSECTASGDMSACPEFDRLIGTRVAVANLELRLALLGTEELGLFNAPAAPTELAFFIDAGAAWSSGQSIDWSFRRDSIERVPVFSAGLAARTVLLGALPLEIFYAHPFQRPGKDAVFGFRIGGGW